MKNLLNKLTGKLFAGVAAAAIVVGVSASALAGFGPNRTTRVWTPAENGFDYVTFNSYTGVSNGIGDERDFLRGVQVGRDSVWSDPVTNVEGGSEVEVKVYIHNDANPDLNTVPDGNGGYKGIAKNVTVKAAIPTASAQTQQINASISAENANPGTITDTLDITGANGYYFSLAYVPGSAKLHEGSNVTALSDNLVTSGVNIGDQKGCFEYVREITFRVKVTVASYKMQKAARLNGEDSTKWRKVVNAKIGDKVDYRIWFANTGTATLQHVAIVDNLPPYVTVVPGSIKSYKGTSVVTVPDSAIQANGKQINIDSGEYKPGDDSYLQFTVTINNDPKIACGTQQLNNNAYATPEGYTTLNDYASVNVYNEKACETPSYVCQELAVAVNGRTVTAKVTAPVSGGAKVKTVTFNYGDGSTPKVTDKLEDSYTYAKDGTYKITATVVFTVDGVDKTVTSENCSKTVTITTTTPPVTPPVLPNTGAGSTIGIFAAVTVLGAVVHNIVRRFAR